MLSVAVYAAAAVCPVIMLVYAGYDSDAVDRRLLLRILGVAQGVFLTDLIFNLVFRFRRTLEESRAVRRVAEAILADADTRTLPTTAGETCGEVLHFFHSRGFLFAAPGYTLWRSCATGDAASGSTDQSVAASVGEFSFFFHSYRIALC